MATHGNRRTPVTAQVASGVAELIPDPFRPRGWTLMVNGVQQSFVDLADPTYLAFSYVRQIGRALRAWSIDRAPRVPERVLHLGGGGMTVPRLMARWWPEIAQRVVEHDPDLVALVLRELPPAQPVEILVGDARAALETEEPRGYDLKVADVFNGADAGLGGVGGFRRGGRRCVTSGRAAGDESDRRAAAGLHPDTGGDGPVGLRRRGPAGRERGAQGTPGGQCGAARRRRSVDAHGE
jgi:hypothetical protein